MPNLPISGLPLATSGQPESLMVIVNYDVDPSGTTNKIYFSALTEQFSGATGSSGTSGTSGADGKSSSLFVYSANTSITSGDPGNGHILWNNSIQTGATQLNISHLTAFDDDIDVYLSLLVTGQVIILQDKNVAENYQSWLVTSNATFMFPDYWSVPVSRIGSNGQGTTNFSNDHELALVLISADGSSGTSGTSGLDGSSGSSGVSGTSGSSGTSGIDGTSGSSGTGGLDGTSGSSGSSGTSGIDGTSGSSGTSGTSGTSPSYWGTLFDPYYDLATLSVGTSTSFTLVEKPPYTVGQTIIIYYDSSNYFIGTITSYNIGDGDTTVTVDRVVGTGAYYNWFTNISGLPGDNGSSGTSGDSGSSGIDGTSGINGSSGTSGTSGTSGSTGTSGSSGSSGFSGDLYRTSSSTPLTIQTGTTGTFVIGTNLGYSVAQDVIIAYNLSNHMIGMVSSYNPSNGNMVVDVVTIIGSGSYSSWVVNLAGAAGGDGSSGTSGSSGVNGTSGTDGSSGTSGTSGSSGSSGTTGTSGTSGSSGVNGTSGIDGTSGSSGSSGTTGTSGTSGSSGVNGTSGIDGTSGSSGTSGIDGTSGSSGTSGTSGSTGTSGSSGTTGTSGSSGTSGSTGTSGSSGTSAAAPPYPIAYGLFSQTSNSITVSGTTTESSLIGTGVGTLTVPSNGFQIGDSFGGRIVGHISSKNNENIRIRVKSDGVILADTGVVTMPQTTNKHYTIDLNFTIRMTGGTGVASIASGIVFTYSKDASNAFEGADFSLVNNTTFNTTISNTLVITAQWGSTDPINSIYSEYFVLSKVY